MEIQDLLDLGFDYEGFEHEQSIKDLLIYDIYSSDVGNRPSLDGEKNRVFLLEINDIINDLDNLFKLAGCDNNMFGKRKVPWIADKIDYCLKHCKDIELITRLKKVYDNYLLVSSKVIEGNLKLVIEIAGEYKENSLIDFNDIIQYGNMGLMRAVEKYKIDCGTQFSTYARYWIKQVISRNINGVRSTFRIPSYAVYEGYDLMRQENELNMLLGRDSTNKELSNYIGLSVLEIEKLKMAFYESISLDEPITIHSGDYELLRSDMIADPNVDVCKQVCNGDLTEKIRYLLSKYLTKREFEMMSKYIGLDGIPYGLEEIAELLGVTPQRVCQLKSNAVKRLRERVTVTKMLKD